MAGKTHMLKDHITHLLSMADEATLGQVVMLLETGNNHVVQSLVGLQPEPLLTLGDSQMLLTSHEGGLEAQTSLALALDRHNNLSTILGIDDDSRGHTPNPLSVTPPLEGIPESPLRLDAAHPKKLMRSSSTLEIPPDPSIAKRNDRRRGGVSNTPLELEDVSAYQPNVVEKSNEETAELLRALKKCQLFTVISDEEARMKIVRAMAKVTFPAGRDILLQGELEKSPKFCLITEGNVAILKEGKNVVTFGPGQVFGELEMMLDVPQPNAATVRAVTAVTCYWIDQPTYKKMWLGAIVAKRSLYASLVDSISFFSALTPYERSTIIDSFESIAVTPDQYIVKYGEHCPYLFIVVSGSATVVGRNEGKKEEVMTFHPGEPIGELEFLFGHVAVADVIAKTEMKLIKISRKHFESAIGDSTVDLLQSTIAENPKYNHYIQNEADFAVLSKLKNSSSRSSKFMRSHETIDAAHSSAMMYTGSNATLLSSAVDCPRFNDEGELVLVALLESHTDGNTKGGFKASSPTTPARRIQRCVGRFPLPVLQQEGLILIGLREDGLIISWNLAAERATRFKETSVVGQSIYSYLRETSDQREMHRMIKVAAKYAGDLESFYDHFNGEAEASTMSPGKSPNVGGLTKEKLEKLENATGADKDQQQQKPKESLIPKHTFSVPRADGLSKAQLQLRLLPPLAAKTSGSETLLAIGTEVRQVPKSNDAECAAWLSEQLKELLPPPEAVPAIPSKKPQPSPSVDVAKLKSILERFESLQHRSNNLESLSVTPIRDLVNRVLTHHQVAARETENELSLHVEKTLPESIFCDTNTLPNILMYLLGNTIKHTTHSQIAFRVRLKIDMGLEFIEFAVETDNPNGIDRRIMTAFKRAEEGKQDPSFQHTKLNKVRMQMKTYGGGMTLESHQDKTAVRLYLPFLPVTEQDSDSDQGSVCSGRSGSFVGSPQSAPQKRTVTTLIVEERQVHRNTLCSYLWERKHAVLPAFTPKDFLHHLKTCDIVIIDPTQQVAMEAAAHTDPISLLVNEAPHAIVIITSSEFTDEARETYRQTGFETLNKPSTAHQAQFVLKKAEQKVYKNRAEADKIARMRDIFNSGDDKRKWTKGKLLGKGSFGEVYEAIDDLTGGKMAVKIMSLKEGESMDETIREIEVMCTMKHENIIHYFHCNQQSGGNSICCFMELASGGTLKDLTKQGPMDQKRLVRVLHDVVAGLRYVHNNGYVHCDIKTANILFGQDDKAKIGDFGTAKKLQPGQKLYVMAGSPLYMAPEVLGADEAQDVGFDFKADIWSLGAVVLEMATGKAPYAHLNIAGMAIMKYLTELTDAPDLSVLFDQAAVFEFVRACMDVDPEKRPTADELLTFALLREDADFASAQKALKRAQLLHSLSKFVAFHEPINEVKEASPTMSIPVFDVLDRTNDFFDSDDESECASQMSFSMTSNGPGGTVRVAAARVGEAAFFSSSDDEEDDEKVSPVQQKPPPKIGMMQKKISNPKIMVLESKDSDVGSNLSQSLGGMSDASVTTKHSSVAAEGSQDTLSNRSLPDPSDPAYHKKKEKNETKKAPEPADKVMAPAPPSSKPPADQSPKVVSRVEARRPGVINMSEEKLKEKEEIMLPDSSGNSSSIPKGITTPRFPVPTADTLFIDFPKVGESSTRSMASGSNSQKNILTTMTMHLHEQLMTLVSKLEMKGVCENNLEEQKKKRSTTTTFQPNITEILCTDAAVLQQIVEHIEAHK